MKNKMLYWMLPLTMLLVVVCLLPTKAQAANVSDLTFTLNEDGNSYSVTGSNQSASSELIIPSTYNGKPVTTISEYAFFGYSSLTSVTIPDSVASIGDGAFYGCTSLTGVYISDLSAWCNINFDWDTYIGNPLRYAEKLYLDGNLITDLVIPDDVTSINQWAFHSCTGLASITIPGSVTSIGEGAFFKCTGLTTVTIPGSVTDIGEGAFSKCTGLTTVTIPDSVASIGEGAFLGCTRLQFNVYDNAKYLGNSGNLYLYLNEVTSDEITTCIVHKDTRFIGSSAFAGCSSLTSITIPGGVTSIGDNAFRDCIGLTSINIGDGVTYVGMTVFLNCTSLTSIAISDSVTSIDFAAFANCTNLSVVFYRGTEAMRQHMNIGFDNSALTSADWHYDVVDTILNEQPCYYCPECDGYFLPDGTKIQQYTVGDFTKDNMVTNEDVIYLLWHTLFPETYPVESQADFTGDGQVTNEDVIYLLWHTLFPESYPLTGKKAEIAS